MNLTCRKPSEKISVCTASPLARMRKPIFVTTADMTKGPWPCCCHHSCNSHPKILLVVSIQYCVHLKIEIFTSDLCIGSFSVLWVPWSSSVFSSLYSHAQSNGIQSRQPSTRLKPVNQSHQKDKNPCQWALCLHPYIKAANRSGEGIWVQIWATCGDLKVPDFKKPQREKGHDKPHEVNIWHRNHSHLHARRAHARTQM